jgi:hypothetical protein
MRRTGGEHKARDDKQAVHAIAVAATMTTPWGLQSVGYASLCRKPTKRRGYDVRTRCKACHFTCVSNARLRSTPLPTTDSKQSTCLL